ncbi:MAG: GAF domain-containing protein [Anaerolineae bacterium]|nr:GAF domain-containing protein [Anaerolineae bacterium]
MSAGSAEAQPERSQHHLSPRIAGLRALRDIARALSVAWDLDTTLDLIVRKTTEVMEMDSCSIYLLDPDGETLRLRATTGLARAVLGKATLQLGEGMTGHAAAINRPVYARDAWNNPHFKWLNDVAEQNLHSLLAVPLVVEEEVIGALNVQTEALHTFTESEVEIVSLIGDLAAGALVKARLHDSQRRQIDELQALAEVSEVVTSPQYLDDILDVVTDMAAKVMNAAVCSIYLVDEEGRQLELRSTRPHTGDAVPPAPRRWGEGIVGGVAASGAPQAVRDLSASGDEAEQALARREGLASLLSVPLSVRDRVIGVFNCYTSRAHTFTPEQETLLLTLANQTALAIEHARLATNAAMVREMHHRIKNNLQTVAMLMRLQLAEADGLDARQAMLNSIHRVHSIAAVHETLSERGFHLVDLRDVLLRVVGMTAAMMAPGKEIAIAVEGEAALLPTRAATSLALVVNELIQNALEHAFSGRAQGRVQVTLARAPGALLVTVADDGQGFAPGYRPGLGMEIVETLVRTDLHGELTYERGAAGTEVSIRVEDAAPESRTSVDEG